MQKPERKKRSHNDYAPLVIPGHLYETRAGHLAFIVGRVVFKPGRPYLVEHIGGLYLEHDLSGAVLSEGYGNDFEIIAMFDRARDIDHR